MLYSSTFIREICGSLSYYQFARDDVVIAVPIRLTVRTDKFQPNRVLAGRPACQCDLLVTVNPFHVFVIDDVADPILATIALQLRIRKREVDQDFFALPKSLAVWKIKYQ